MTHCARSAAGREGRIRIHYSKKSTRPSPYNMSILAVILITFGSCIILLLALALIAGASQANDAWDDDEWDDGDGDY